MGNLFYRTPPVGLIKKEVKFTNKEFCWRRFVENKLADYLKKHSMFLFEIKERTPRVLLMLKTPSLLLWSQKLQIMTFFIQSDSNRVCT